MQAVTKAYDAQKLSDMQAMLQTFVPSGRCLEARDGLSVLPNETLHRIMGFLFSEDFGVRKIRDIPILCVSHRYLAVGLKALLNARVFTFSSSQLDHDFYVRRPSRTNPPSSRDLQIDPDPAYTQFEQTDGVLSLRSVCETPLRCLPDPVPMIRKVRIAFEVPHIGLHAWPANRAALAARPPGHQRITHLYLTDNLSLADYDAWIAVELSHHRAEYHFGVLQKLPFGKLKLLVLDFRSYEPNAVSENYDEDAAKWIGRYLWGIETVKMAERVLVVGQLDHWAELIEDIIEWGFN